MGRKECDGRCAAIYRADESVKVWDEEHFESMGCVDGMRKCPGCAAYIL